jgi:type VI secretion system protein
MRHLLHLAWLRGVCMALFLCAAGCSGTTLRVNIVVEPEANSNSPVVMSAVFIHSQAMVGKLQDLTAAQWFAKREQMLRDFPRDVEELYWEFVPGQQVPQIQKTMRRTPVLGLLFANYRSPGAHRYLFDPKRAQEWICGLREIKLPQ